MGIVWLTPFFSGQRALSCVFYHAKNPKYGKT